MSNPIVHGPPGSSYVQTVRLTLSEKGVAYDMRDVDLMKVRAPPYTTDMHPFGRVPVFEHGGVRIYETQAIIRYIDEEFDGPPLQPRDAISRARMNQAIGIVENYAQGAIHGGGSINFYRTFAQKIGAPIDEARVQAAIPRARTCLTALERLLTGSWFGGEHVGLADTMVAPILFVLEHTPEGKALFEDHQALHRWLVAIKTRPSAKDVLMAP